MTYTEILQQADFPTEILLIDFESYYDVEYTLSKMSTVEYVTDPRFEFTGLGIEILNHPKAAGPMFVPGPQVEWAIGRLQKLFGKHLHNCTVVAKNCKFDMLILVEKFGIYPAFPLDIEDLSRTYDSRMSQKLKDLATYFKLDKPKGDTKQFKGLHYAEMSEQQRSDLAEYGRTDIELETALLKILLPYVSNPGFELALARHTLGMYLQPVFKLDYKLASELMSAMYKELDTTLDLVNHTKEEISGTLSFTEILLQELSKLSEPGKLPTKPGKPGKNMVKLLGTSGVIPALAKTDEGFKQLLNHKNENIRNLMKAKVAIKSWPNWIKRVNSMINQCKASGDKLRVPMKFYAAHTGRWGGTEKINLLALGGKGRGAPIHPLIAQVCNLMVAPDGYKLINPDSSQIEARLLAWLAGQDDLLQDFREGKSPYCSLATELFGEEVWKPSDEEKKTPEGKVMAVRYGFGKDGILGSGYGMGPAKFFTNCIINNSLRPLFRDYITLEEKPLQKIMTGLIKNLKARGLDNYVVPESGNYDKKFIAYLILTYRKKYAKIPALWRSIEKAFRFVCKYPGESKLHYVNGNPALHFWKSGLTVNIQLPSGRVLYYHHAKVNSKGDISYDHGKLWGGTLVENIIQSIARDLLGYWILECEEWGCPVILSCHDEIVSYSLCGNEEQDLQRAINIMSQGPAWAEGIPLDAEGQISGCYVK